MQIYMNRKTALKIARHLTSRVLVTAANGPRRDYGFIAACGERQKRKIDVGTYSEAVASRREHIERLVERLQDGIAPSWANLDFVW